MDEHLQRICLRITRACQLYINGELDLVTLQGAVGAQARVLDSSQDPALQAEAFRFVEELEGIRFMYDVDEQRPLVLLEVERLLRRVPVLATEDDEPAQTDLASD